MTSLQLKQREPNEQVCAKRGIIGEPQRRDWVRGIFDSSARDYDRIERMMALGTGSWYRRQALLRAGLAAGMRVVDVGCGWGEALKFAAERYRISGVGVTISAEQADYARRLCAGLPIEIRLQDYRDLDERFDAAFSLGMFEHVGVKNYATFFDVIRRCLPADGLFLLHTIGTNRSVQRTDPWIARYIFPNSMLPSIAQIGRAAEGRFVIEDLHNFGADYDPTLMQWKSNVDAAWDELRASGGYDDRFKRMWDWYLLSSAGSFRARKLQLWQIVMSADGVPGGYHPAGVR